MPITKMPGYAIKTRLEPKLYKPPKKTIPKGPAFKTTLEQKMPMLPKSQIATAFKTPAATAAAAVPPSTPPVTPPLGNADAMPQNWEASLAEIMGNPLSELALGQYNTNNQTMMRALQAALGNATIKSGYDPSAAFQKLLSDNPDLGEFAGLINPTALETAKTNPLSERAQAEQGYTRGMSNLDYELAARGMGGSGAQATGGNQITQAKQLAENQSRQGWLDALNQGIGGYLQNKSQGYQGLLDTYGQVAALLAQKQGAVYDQGGYVPGDIDEETIPGTTVPSAATPTPPPRTFLNWGGQKIKNVNEMKAWLKAHGQNYATWAQRYPAAAQQLANLRG